ncbi:MAG: Ig-like domain-containing protein [Gemmatimonadaceae bacterium]|nr:Ig-like domain-containing protein [Gemmatimonadaceae bacterium]
MRIASLRSRLTLAGVLLLSGCGGGGDSTAPPPNPPQVRGVSVTPAAATLRVGDSQSLSALVDAINGASTGVTWTSESPAVASVSASGTVTAVAAGTAVIRATSTFNAAFSGTALITVQARRTISVSPATVSLGSGQTATLAASVSGEPGFPTAVTWRTSTATVATVNASSGVVTGVALGTATITAVSIGDTTLTATATVNIVPVVRSVTVTPTTASVFIGNTQQITATVNADAGAVNTLTWRTSNPAVATVSGTGVVTAVTLGTATITALSTADTTKRATSAITVPARTIAVSITQRNVSVNPGTSLTLNAVVTADPGVNANVNWTSSNAAAATINASGVLTGVASGSTLITATSQADNTKRDTLTVNVVPRLAATWTPSRLGGALYEDVVAIAPIDATNAFAVNSVGDLYRWNGTAWAPSATGASLGTTFYAVHGTTATNVIAVGSNGVVVRWNGTTWNAMASGTTRALYGVWVEDATTAYAVGDNGTVLRLSGNTWSTEAAGSTASLNSVWSGSGVVYAVGANGEMLRKSGTWSKVALPTLETLYAVHGLSATDVVAAGAAGTLLKFDGTTWSTLSAGGFSGAFYGIDGSAANGGRRYLVGDGGVAQLDGATTSMVSTPYAPRMYSVEMDASGNVWTGGQRGIVMRGAGTWSTNNMAPDLLDVWTSTPTSAYAVGEFGTVYRWNGTAWTRQNVPTTVTLEAVWSPNANEAFAGGDNGTILRFNGTAWTLMTVPTTASIYNLWGTSNSDVWAVTSAGEVLRYNGVTWQLAANAPQPLWTIFGVSPTQVIVAGENGLVQRFNGTSWTTLTAPATGTQAGVWMTSASDIYAVGANGAGTVGTAFNYNGTAWSSLQVGSTRILTSIWGPSLFDLYATGDQGTLLRYNGNTWTAVNTGTTDLLWSISSAPSAVGGAFAVGYNSTVLAGSGGSALRAGPAVVGGSLEPRAGTRAVRGALPTGAARKDRR